MEWKRSPTNMPIRLEDSSQATSQFSKIAGSAAKDRNVRNASRGGM